jgi:hypothetical protein
MARGSRLKNILILFLKKVAEALAQALMSDSQ